MYKVWRGRDETSTCLLHARIRPNRGHGYKYTCVYWIKSGLVRYCFQEIEIHRWWQCKSDGRRREKRKNTKRNRSLNFWGLLVVCTRTYVYIYIYERHSRAQSCRRQRDARIASAGDNLLWVHVGVFGRRSAVVLLYSDSGTKKRKEYEFKGKMAQIKKLWVERRTNE